MYTVIWEANGIHHEARVENRLTAMQIQEAIQTFWHDDGIRIVVWNGREIARELVS